MNYDERDDRLEQLRRAVEATRLNFGLTAVEVRDLVRRAYRLAARGVCVPPCFAATAVSEARELGAPELDVVTVANFPTGDRSLDAVVREAEEAVRAGAVHIDVVVPGALVAERDWRRVSRFLSAVRRSAASAAARSIAIKVILETAAWDEERLRGAAGAAIDAGAAWLKTSTGFHPRGGATIEAVRLLRSVAPAGVGVKASGGIRSREAALAMLDAGADRIGTSSEETVLETMSKRRRSGPADPPAA